MHRPDYGPPLRAPTRYGPGKGGPQSNGKSPSKDRRRELSPAAMWANWRGFTRIGVGGGGFWTCHCVFSADLWAFMVMRGNPRWQQRWSSAGGRALKPTTTVGRRRIRSRNRRSCVRAWGSTLPYKACTPCTRMSDSCSRYRPRSTPAVARGT